jgi:hypothetical protein
MAKKTPFSKIQNSKGRVLTPSEMQYVLHNHAVLLVRTRRTAAYMFYWSVTMTAALIYLAVTRW